MEEKRIIVAQMRSREPLDWTPQRAKKRRRIHISSAAGLTVAAVLCLTGVSAYMRTGGQDISVMAHLTAGFEYDETLGRLQFVSSMLPESAMVFLTQKEDMLIFQPVIGLVTHAWSQEEPWLEYADGGTVSACQNGEVMTIVMNGEDAYTLRLVHDDGYESVYSGVGDLSVQEGAQVKAGERLGSARETAAFELRKDGISVLPTFGYLE